MIPGVHPALCTTSQYCLSATLMSLFFLFFFICSLHPHVWFMSDCFFCRVPVSWKPSCWSKSSFFYWFSSLTWLNLFIDAMPLRFQRWYSCSRGGHVIFWYGMGGFLFFASLFGLCYVRFVVKLLDVLGVFCLTFLALWATYFPFFTTGIVPRRGTDVVGLSNWIY